MNMTRLQVKVLVKRIINKIFKLFTQKFVGSFLFYEIVIKNTFRKNLVDNLTGENLDNLITNCFNILAANRLKILCMNSKNKEELIDLGFNFRFSIPYFPLFLKKNIQLKTFQIKSEIIEFLNLVNAIKPKTVLEIGTAMGGTLFLLSRFSSSKALLISMDLLSDDISSRNFDFYKKIARSRQSIVFLEGDSHKRLTLEKVEKILKDRKVELLFIDGDHSYEGIKKDFKMYSPLVKSGALVCFHDIVPGDPKKVGGVPEFWKEIRERYETQEIVENWNQAGYGIGIIFMK